MSESINSLKKFGKSFFWAGKILPNFYFKRSADLYHFCRKMDDIADENQNIHTLENLKLIKSFIQKEDYNKLNRLGIFIPEFLKDDNASKKAMKDLLDGLIFDQKRVRIKDLDELIKYCYRVAGTVGIMMCNALDCKEEKAKNFAIDLGIAMQLTNIIRDVLEDAKIDRVYLPSSMTNNITSKKILLISKDPNTNLIDNKRIKQTLKKLLEISDQYYISGKQGLIFLPSKVRISIAVAANIYREIGLIIKSKSYDWHLGRQYTSLIIKIKVTLLTIFQHLFFSSRKSFIHNESFHLSIKDDLK